MSRLLAVDCEPLATSGCDGIFVASPGGNLGDDLIAAGCIRFLREAGLDVVDSAGALEAAVARGDTAYLSAVLGSFEGVVIFSGGGNIGIYPDNEQRRRLIIEHAPRARRFLVMPQSCAAPEPALRDPRVEVWAREEASRQMLQRSGVTTRLVPDAAFVLADRIAASPGGRAVLNIRRTPGTCRERVEHAFAAPGPVADPTLTGTLDAAMATIAPFATVISDRLHGGILASMMQKRVGLLAVAYHKNRSFFETWFSRDPGVAFLDSAEEVQRFLGDDTRSTTAHREVFYDRAQPALRTFLDLASRPH